MKELSIEDKARRYDEVFSAAKEWYNNPNSSSIGKSYLYAVLPELKENKESEDENIRKGIIKYLEQSQFGEEHYCVDDDIVRDYIAWLEKRCEKGTNGNDREIPISEQEPVEVRTTGYWNVQDIEQKPAEWHREDEQNLNACLGYIPDEFLRRWLTDIIHVKYDKSNNKVESNLLTVERAKEMSPFMRSGFENKSAAWSEEDEKIKESIITGLEMLKDGASDKSLIALYNKKIDWLKSLKDKYTWKPSDEQMEALETALYTNMSRNDERYSVLSEFVAELKKLREE